MASVFTAGSGREVWNVRDHENWALEYHTLILLFFMEPL